MTVPYSAKDMLYDFNSWGALSALFTLTDTAGITIERRKELRGLHWMPSLRSMMNGASSLEDFKKSECPIKQLFKDLRQ